mmetsp:Transcript_35850/g.34898  ORF Transcript_35850/g.34898 Transcript_35850/m.34898 type:complete len:151 (+) Transcript_35850:1-453(+)
MGFIFNFVFLPLIFCFVYFFYRRVAKVEYQKAYYLRQGVKLMDGCGFGYGHIYRVMKMQNFTKTQEFQEYITIKMLYEDYQDKNNKFEFPDVAMQHFGPWLIFIINHHELLSDLFHVKNKYFDKHPMVRDYLKPLMGGSIIFCKGDLKWS